MKELLKDRKDLEDKILNQEIKLFTHDGYILFKKDGNTYCGQNANRILHDYNRSINYETNKTNIDFFEYLVEKELMVKSFDCEILQWWDARHDCELDTKNKKECNCKHFNIIYSPICPTCRKC